MSAAPTLAETCPPVPDHSDRLAALLYELRQSIGPAQAHTLSRELWQIWTDAPDERAQAMLDEGMRKRGQHHFLGARDVLDQLVEYCPHYAEGYNQRAFASFLRQDFEAALIDLDQALEILPTHIGALSGKGLTLIWMGRKEEGREALRAALALNPWLQERHLIADPDSTDI